MDAELKRKWVEALRSGKYKQTRGRLRTKAGTKHCCLGVLCELVGRDHWNSDDMRWLPVAELDAAHINQRDGLILARMNDGRRHTFAEIADYIEQSL